MHYKYIIIGAGITGLTIAERLSSGLNEEVLVIEKRNEIGGNLFDFYNEHGILVHKYGPHIFHTNKKEVWEYLSQFTAWNDYQHTVKAFVDGEYLSLPISLKTIEEFYKIKKSDSEMICFMDNLGAEYKNKEINNAEDYLLSEIGKDLYEKIFMNYTFKQWGKPAKELQMDVVKRLPIRKNFDTRYFDDKFQGIPQNSYSQMFKNMTRNKNIKIITSTDYKTVINKLSYKTLIYTGPLDYFFDYKFGKLNYRSVKFKFETHQAEYFQSYPTINYPNDYDYTRVTEFKYLTKQKNRVTTILKEYPSENGEEFYPVNEIENEEKVSKYRKEADSSPVYFAGRLAEYKYYNIDEAVEKALKTAALIIERDKN